MRRIYDICKLGAWEEANKNVDCNFLQDEFNIAHEFYPGKLVSNKHMHMSSMTERMNPN